MRISTNLFYDTGAARITNAQSTLEKTSEQISSGKRILTPADDPVAAARVVELTQAQATNKQYADNRGIAADALNTEETTLKSVTDLLQDLKTKVIEAGNPSYDDSQRKSMATELAGRFSDLLGLANATDGSGSYIFSGYQVSIQPFTKTATGASFNGDQGARVVQVGPQRQFAINDNGAAVFESIRNGNGTFVTSAANNNSGSGTISTGSVVDRSALTGDAYSITFTSDTTYDIFDKTTSTYVSQNNTYQAGGAISFGGMQVQISGTPTGSPTNGDSFDIQPSKNQSIFTALKNLIDVLNTPASTEKGKADLVQGLQTAHNMINNALDNVTMVRASVGTRLHELDTLDTQGGDRDSQYAQAIANLQELDYTKAVTDLSKQKIMLEAMQQTFVQISNLSLLKYVS
jgi:flagellar hook-associated protein 3 FlgL